MSEVAAKQPVGKILRGVGMKSGSGINSVTGWLRLWFGLSEPVLRLPYAVSGVCLGVGKYLAEAALVASLGAGWLSPIDFLNPSLTARRELLEFAPEWLGWAYFAWNLPFVWIALSMSVRRCASAGVSPWWGMFVVLPAFGMVEMLILCVVPDRAVDAWQGTAAADQASPPKHHQSIASLRAVLAGLGVGIGMLLVCVYLINSYGAALFLGTPVVMGAVSGYIYNRDQVRSKWATGGLGWTLMLAAGGVLLLFALEGAICIVMAAPIVAPLGVLGVFLGRAVAIASSDRRPPLLPVLAVLPMLAGAEQTTQQAPVWCVSTEVEVAAPPEAVWPHVVAFPDLGEPQEWFFRCGVACPLRARIVGQGVGAVRHCEFTTGDFVEPITVWDEPHRLAFDVTSQPDPLTELSPWRHVHPPHLADQSLASQRGEFRLIPLPNGSTRLEGRTWYTFDMHPQAYWTLWSDLAIHAIHRRVLNHIKQLAEAKPAALPKLSPQTRPAEEQL